MIKKLTESNNTILYEIVVDGKHAAGVATKIPNSELEILQISCVNGMLFCGIFNTAVIDKLQIPAGVFSAPTLEDMLVNKPVFLSEAALSKGAHAHMTGRELLLLLS